MMMNRLAGWLTRDGASVVPVDFEEDSAARVAAELSDLSGTKVGVPLEPPDQPLPGATR